MSKNEKKSPELRFKGFSDAWEQRKLNDIAEVNPKSNLPPKFKYVDLESVIGNNLVNYRNETLDSAPSRAQRVAQKGDIFFQTVRPYQKNNYLFDINSDDYVFSSGYAQIRTSLPSKFLLYGLQDQRFVNKVLKRSTGTSYPAINSNDLALIELKVPNNNEEQIRIGEFLMHIESVITLHQRKINILKKLKQQYLILMFPENNNNTPKLRFKNFKEEWETQKIGDVITIVKRPLNLEENKKYQLVTVRRKNAGIESRGWLKGKEILVKSYFILEKGDYLISKRQVVHGANGIVPDTLNGAIVSNEYLVIRGNEKLTTQFLSLLSLRPHMYRVFFLSSYGIDIEKLVFDVNDWKKRELALPSINEQKSINNFFKILDKSIKYHQKNSSILLKLKKTYLKKMFL